MKVRFEHVRDRRISIGSEAALKEADPLSDARVRLWAMLLCRIERLVLGGRHDQAMRPDLGGYNVETFLKLTGRPLQLVTGVRQLECEEPFRAWLAAHSLQGMGPPR